jgi:hypothetical protein
MATMIVSSSGNRPTNYDTHEDVFEVATPLDAIVRLETQRIRTVVLAGSYATNRELAAFVGEFYPTIRIECEA